MSTFDTDAPKLISEPSGKRSGSTAMDAMMRLGNAMIIFAWLDVYDLAEAAIPEIGCMSYTYQGEESSQHLYTRHRRSRLSMTCFCYPTS